MPGILQEIAGLRRLLSRIGDEVGRSARGYADLDDGRVENFHTELTDAEIDTCESLILDLYQRVTGLDTPSPSVWERLDSYVRREYKRRHGTEFPDSKDYFYWAATWVQKSMAFLEYLEGFVEVEGPVAHDSDSITAYEVALSFAGEDRQIARRLAEGLREKEVAVFYDEYEKAQLWGKDLYAHLSEIYKNKARFCVMLISAAYAKKLWTNHERKSAQARAFLESEEYILPVRVDDTQIPGVLETTGYLDLRAIEIDEVVEMLLKKLGR